MMKSKAPNIIDAGKGVLNNPFLVELGISPELIAARNLCQFEEAVSLQLAETGKDGREHYLIKQAALSWLAMKQAAINDGESLFIISAFRSVSRQVEIVRGKLDQGLKIEEILSVCAPPGYSEHHTGRAVDLSTHEVEVLTEQIENTTAYVWLSQNAHQFNYYLSYPRGNENGYQFEPWHWCYKDDFR